MQPHPTPKPFTEFSDCPYGADDCPKVGETKDMLNEIRSDVKALQRMVYIMLGMLAIEFGWVIF